MTVVRGTDGRPNWKDRLRNYRRPLLATAVAIAGIAAVTAGGIQYVEAHTTEYYHVLLQGEPIGEVSSKAKVEQWLAHQSAQSERLDTPVRYVPDEGQVTYRLERAYKKRTDDEAMLALLADRVRTHPVGVQLIVNNRVVGIVRDQQTARSLLNRVRNKYAPPTQRSAETAAMKPVRQLKTLSLSPATLRSTAQKRERIVTSVQFAEEVRMAEVKISEHQLSDPDQLFAELTAGLDETGDFTDTKPALTVKTVEQVTQTEPIEATVEYKKSKVMRVGQSKVLREGQDGQKRVNYRLRKNNGSVLEEEVVAEQILRKATSTVILKGTKVVLGEGTGKFSWPVMAHRITSYMGQRWGRMHKGIDLVGQSSILAADNGVVEFAGYKSGGHGNTVIIDHNNGFKTLYAHMKSVKVKKGQVVQKGDQLGIMGSTGHSTGTHLHFEIHRNGKLNNPTSFL